MNKRNILVTFLGLFSANLALSYTAYASHNWQSFCSNITSTHNNVSTNTITATNYTIQAVNDPAVKMITQQLTATKSNNTLSSDQLQRITNITSTGILNLVLNHQMQQCNKNYYIDSLTPLINSLQKGNHVNFTWNNVTFQNKKASYKVGQLIAQLSNTGNNIHIIVRFTGLSTTSPLKIPSTLIPTQGNIDILTTPKVYPLILASTSGNTSTGPSNTTLPITVNNLNLRNTTTSITAHGNLTVNGKLTLTSALGLLQITNMNTLISACNENSNSKLKTGLILAKFAGRTVGDNKLEWDINWQGTLLKVNNVPIPVW